MMMYGNMSKEEKMLNKEDLVAYKRFDNNQYAMIPGVSSQKAIMSPDLKKSPNKTSGKGSALDKEMKLQ